MSCLCILYASARNCGANPVPSAGKFVFLPPVAYKQTRYALEFECCTLPLIRNHLHTAHNTRPAPLSPSPPPFTPPPLHSPVGSSLNHLSGTITGPDGTPYAKGVFKIDIHIPTSYPFEPPKMKFLTKIWCVGRGAKGGREGGRELRKEEGRNGEEQPNVYNVCCTINALAYPPSLGHT